MWAGKDAKLTDFLLETKFLFDQAPVAISGSAEPGDPIEEMKAEMRRYNLARGFTADGKPKCHPSGN